ncbi:hypothetical protein BGX38DRAFT_772060 [Terfezia claveryi]|nr:hypothetical protein BGX38DRAFT_772060 [Terfezia claveryi]
MMKFTSNLILRVYVAAIFPPPYTNPLPTIESPVQLLKITLSHLSPKQLLNKQICNKTGPSENAFHVELYATLRTLLPLEWLCSSEARIDSQQKRLDLLIHKDIHKKKPTGGFDLRSTK